MLRSICALVAGCAGALLAGTAGTPAAARTWTVATDGSGDFTLIQDAIDTAAYGDRIEIATGAYDENLDLRGKVIDLVGVAGAGATVVDGGERREVLEIPSTGGGVPRIEGITLTGGIGKIVRGPVPDGRYGGGVFIELAAPEFVDCVIEDNRADAGGGVFVLSGAPTFTRCTIRDNVAGTGAGVALHVDRGARFVECAITGNAGVFGGGIDTFQGNGTFERCRIAGNSASEGAALRALERDYGGGSVTIDGCLLARNYGDYGSALVIEQGSADVRSTTIAANEGPGAIVEVWSGSLRLSDTIVSRMGSAQIGVCTGDAEVEASCVVAYAPGVGIPACMDGPTVLRADPLFCNPENEDYHLAPDSPALPGQGPPGCALIGAYGPSCDEPVAVAPAPWGRIRALWR